MHAVGGLLSIYNETRRMTMGIVNVLDGKVSDCAAGKLNLLQ